MELVAVVDNDTAQAQAVASQFGCLAFSNVEELFGRVDAASVAVPTIHHRSVAAALMAAGSAVDRLVQVRVYVTDIKTWPAFNALNAKWIGASRPARAVVPVPELHFGFKIEIEAVALVGVS